MTVESNAKCPHDGKKCKPPTPSFLMSCRICHRDVKNKERPSKKESAEVILYKK